jgi:hypothetical protein
MTADGRSHEETDDPLYAAPSQTVWRVDRHVSIVPAGKSSSPETRRICRK